jgi:hypothetical protein
MSMMICNGKQKCKKLCGKMCIASMPHDCEDHTGEDEVHCAIIGSKARCIPFRSYDAEGRAARLKCIRFLRVTRLMTAREYQREAMRVLAKGILKAMREARKGAK